MLKSSTLSEIAEDFLLESNVDEGVLLVALEAAFRERGRKTSSRKNEEKKTKAKSKGKEKEKETQTRRKRKRTNRIHLANRKEERLVHLVWKIHELKEKDSQTHPATTPSPSGGVDEREKFLSTLLRHMAKTVLVELERESGGSGVSGGGGVTARAENECLCRGFTALSALRGQGERVRVFCCDLITICGGRTHCYPTALSMIANVVSVWGGVFSIKGEVVEEETEREEGRAVEEPHDVRGGKLLVETVKGILCEMYRVALEQHTTTPTTTTTPSDGGVEVLKRNFDSILASTGWTTTDTTTTTTDFANSLVEQLLSLLQSVYTKTGTVPLSPTPPHLLSLTLSHTQHSEASGDISGCEGDGIVGAISGLGMDIQHPHRGDSMASLGSR